MSPEPPGRDPHARRQLILRVSERGRLTAPAPSRPLDGLEPGAAQAHLVFVEALLTVSSVAGIAQLLLQTAVVTYGFPRGAVLSGQKSLIVLAGHALTTSTSRSGSSPAVTDANALQRPRVVNGPELSKEPLLGSLFPTGSELLVVPLGDLRRQGGLVVELPVVLHGHQRERVAAQLSRLATSASAALHREQRLAQLERLASTDGLTMIANRRNFNTSLDREIARSVRSGEPVSLVMLDVDLFKQVNDRYGHPAGDESLRNIAASLVIASRDVDIPARYGGEEFAVILPNCPPDEALDITERLRAAIAAAPGVMALTASAGVASFPMHATGAEDLVAAADAALLTAKAEGRDRAVLSSRPRQDVR